MSHSILIIEDEASVRESIRDILSLIELECVLVGNGEEGLKKAKAIHPQMIVTDVHLPDMSGYQVCQSLKRDPEFRTTPVVMMSGRFTEPQDRVQGLESGADEYFLKPFDPAYFLARVKSILRQVTQS